MGGAPLPADAQRPTLGTSTRDAAVVEMFDELSANYDFLNRVVTFNQDIWWRKKLVDLVPAGGLALDFGCGTGDLVMRLLERKKAARAVGFDITRGMLRRASERLEEEGPGMRGRARLVQGDGERLPFRDGAFDVVVSAFVMRNVGARESAYREIARVLKPGRRFVQLELGKPRANWFRSAYYVYFFHIMPVLGRLFYGELAPYRYLAESLHRFPDQEGTAREIEGCGFASVEIREFSWGIVAAHVASK